MASENAVEYVIGRSAVNPNRYTVSKFKDGDDGAPLQVYTVIYNRESGAGRCDCPAGVYRKLGPADKHVKMVAAWCKEQKL
jgi:hypothetical protein